MPQDKPTWELVGPDENGLMVLQWTGINGKVQGVPLGDVEEVSTRFADWLAERDFGEL